MGSYQRPTTVAIVGGGPAGLASAIALSRLPYLSVKIYERNPEPREVGAGLSLSYNAWKVLDLLGAADGVKGSSKIDTRHRNGYTGKVVLLQQSPENAAVDKRGAIRARRTRLQSGLLQQIPPGVIEFGKKLLTLENKESGGVRLLFEDGYEITADLVVGADGIRSVVRRTLYPDLSTKFTGNTAWRVLVPKSSLTHVPEITRGTSWWYGKCGHAYFSGVDDPSELAPGDGGLFEISLRSYNEPEIPGTTVSWGIPATNEKVKSRFLEYDERVQNAIAAVPEGRWREFANFAGPGPANITAWDKVVLVGDASHPLHGAFGSGATFGMEDGWVLAQAIDFESNRESTSPLATSLQIFEEIRLPYYKRMYAYLDRQREKLKALEAAGSDLEEILNARFGISGAGKEDSLDWIYKHDIQHDWLAYLAERKADHIDSIRGRIV